MRLAPTILTLPTLIRFLNRAAPVLRDAANCDQLSGEQRRRLARLASEAERLQALAAPVKRRSTIGLEKADLTNGDAPGVRLKRRRPVSDL